MFPALPGPSPPNKALDRSCCLSQALLVYQEKLTPPLELKPDSQGVQG